MSEDMAQYLVSIFNAARSLMPHTQMSQEADGYLSLFDRLVAGYGAD